MDLVENAHEMLEATAEPVNRPVIDVAKGELGLSAGFSVYRGNQPANAIYWDGFFDIHQILARASGCSMTHIYLSGL